jgi:hypothetical protein
MTKELADVIRNIFARGSGFQYRNWWENQKLVTG